MSKQTATQYLIQEIKNDSLVQAKSTQEWNEVFIKALQMEREQIIQSHGNKVRQDIEHGRDVYRITTGQQYYNETYGGQDEK